MHAYVYIYGRQSQSLSDEVRVNPRVFTKRDRVTRIRLRRRIETRSHLSLHIYIYICMYMYVCMYVYVCVCIHISLAIPAVFR